jgi:succinate dehydrogenase/fumarate reductase flavoprotein subunit
MLKNRVFTGNDEEPKIPWRPDQCLSMAEVIAMGSLVGKAAAEKAMELDAADGFETTADEALASLESLFADKGQKSEELVEELKATMWLNVGIVRDRQSLNRALEIIMERKDVPAMVKSTRDLIRFL